MRSISKKNIIMAVGLGFFVLTGTLFTNMVSGNSDCDSSDLCKQMFNLIKNPKDHKFSLSNAKAIDHIINRLGYGVNPADPSTTSANPTDENLKRILFSVSQTVENPSQHSFMNAELTRLSESYTFTTPITKIQFNPITDSVADLHKKYKKLQDYWAKEEAAIPTDGDKEEIDRKKIQIASDKFGDGALFRSKVFASTTQFRLLMNVFSSQIKSGNLIGDQQVNFSGVLHDFWFNHFNVDYTKIKFDAALGSDSYERLIYEKMAGEQATFADLLEAVVTHSAMLIYLDNHTNRIIYPPDDGKLLASNQNLGRELIELHTLGIGPGEGPKPGGYYSQEDVEGSSLMLTGLNIDGGDSNGGYKVTRNYNLHVPDYMGATVPRRQTAPVVMGKRFCLDAGTIIDKNIACPDKKDTRFSAKEKVDKVTDIQRLYFQFLASHKRTKTNICEKLVSRFISVLVDSNGKAEVERRCIAEWGVYGNLNAMYRAILTSPQMWDSRNAGTMFKNPMELAISAVRATGLTTAEFGTIAVPQEEPNKPLVSQFGYYLYKQVGTLGLPYRTWMTPTGYDLQAASWINQGYFARWVRVGFNLTNIMESQYDRYSPIMNIQSNVGLNNSNEKVVLDLNTGDERYNKIRLLMGYEPTVHLNNEKIRTAIKSYLSPELPSYQTSQRIGRKFSVVPLKTGLILEISSAAFTRK